MAEEIGGKLIHELRVVDLKKELEARSLSKTGSKKDLVERLKSHLAEEEKKSEVSCGTNVPDERGDCEKEAAKNHTHESPPVKKQRRRSTSSSSSSSGQHRSRSGSREQLRSDKRARSKHAARSRSSSASSSNSGSTEGYRKSHSRSPSKGRSRSRSPSRSSSKARSRSRSVGRSRSISRSPSSSKPRSRSMSHSKSRSRSRSKSRLRSKSSSVEPVPKSPDGKARHASLQKDSAMKADDSYYTAPEDMSVDKDRQSFAPEKIEETAEEMETDDGVFENKHETERKAEQGKVGSEDDISGKTGHVTTAVAGPDVDKSEVKIEKPVRKRRWGSRRNSSKTCSSSINISTDSLKSLIPEVTASALKSDSLLDLDAGPDVSDDQDPKCDSTQEDIRDDDDRDDVPPPALKRSTSSASQEVKCSENGVDERKVEKKLPESSPKMERKKEAEERVATTPVVVPRRISATPRASVTGVVIDEPEAARRSPSPARNPVNRVVHLRNLVRPYTILQLQELLRRSGALAEDGFWIDKVKSHCFVTYEAEDEATAARQALHGTRWPSSNPKILRVEYASQDELNFYRVGKVPGGLEPPTATSRQNSLKEAAPVRRQSSDEVARQVKLKEAAAAKSTTAKKPESIREWDRDKLRQSREHSREALRRGERRRSSPTARTARGVERPSKKEEKHTRETSPERRNKREKKEKKDDEEVPAKLLDDLFRKTKATPCIYWLPLTEELIAKRATERKQRDEDRDKRRKLMDKENEEGRQKAREERMKIRDNESSRDNDSMRDNDRSRDNDRTRRDSRHRY